MEVDGGVVSPSAFAHGVSAAAESGRRVNERRAASGEPTYTITPFDLLTAAAMVVFAEARVDVAVLEVGLGGRWDATSATDPVAVAITGIGLDHTHILGDTLEEIASETAAVLKPGRTVVLGEGTHEPSVERVMRARCDACGVVPWVVDVAVLEVGLGGRWDATSATDPVAVAITGIGLDHTHILGDTLEEIASETAAVLKPGRTVVLGEGTHEPSVERVMRARCDACGVVPWVVRHTVVELPVGIAPGRARRGHA